ncbi:MAG TPA: hypothetical protein VGK93_00780 [Candidatus Eisenbacteria bacterium]|jgi:hypothetical protein
MPTEPSSPLAAVERLKVVFGGEAASRKLALLHRLEQLRLPRASEVLRLHEVLCFLQAYPDNAAVLSQVERMLSAFDRRLDLRRHARKLSDSGIAGTEIRFGFFAPTARWLAQRWPRQLSIDWTEFENRERLEPWLALLAHPAEVPALDEYDLDPRQWIVRLKGDGETDAAFLIRRFAELGMDPEVHEAVYDDLDPPIRLAPGTETPSRTRAKWLRARVTWQRSPLSRARPRVPQDILEPPLSVRPVSRRDGQRLIDVARESMVTRSRDLDVFSYGDPRDVRLVDCGAGLQFACIGAIPERRLLLEAVYGYLTLKNGVPVGYVLSSALFGSSEIAYNVFETFRGAEAGPIYGRVMAMIRHLFGSDTFTIVPYQLGEGNDEAIESGAWWFYQKVGFRPRDSAARRLMRRELARMRRDPEHRSSASVLRRLARANLFLHLGRPRADVIGELPLASVGLATMRYLAARFGSNRERARQACADQAAVRLGVRSFAGWTRGERLAWERWAPLVLSLSGVESWSRAERRSLVEVARAKGGLRESDFVRRFDAHRKLRRAIRSLALREPA